MLIGLAGDHAGFELMQFVEGLLKENGHQVKHFGATKYDASDDYPDFVVPMAQALASNTIDRGIAVCGSGVGASIAANKVNGVRAALINDTFSAHQGVEDDDMNVLCLGGRLIGKSVAKEIVEAFLKAEFSGEERHLRRLEKIKRLEG